MTKSGRAVFMAASKDDQALLMPIIEELMDVLKKRDLDGRLGISALLNLIMHAHEKASVSGQLTIEGVLRDTVAQLERERRAQSQ